MSTKGRKTLLESSLNPYDPRRQSEQFYSFLCSQGKSLCSGFWPSDLANLSALLWESLPDLNWAGFYLLHGELLKLGPFQGKVACTQIALHQGVCGAAASSKKTLVVPDVHDFPGHIACDSRSNSEIVLPLVKEGILLGVLDLDSPLKSRFSPEDEKGLTLFAEEIIKTLPLNLWSI